MPAKRPPPLLSSIPLEDLISQEPESSSSTTPEEIPQTLVPQAAAESLQRDTKPNTNGIQGSPLHDQTITTVETSSAIVEAIDYKLPEIPQTLGCLSRYGHECSHYSRASIEINDLEVDRGIKSRNFCIVVLGFSWLTAVGCVVFGAYLVPAIITPVSSFDYVFQHYHYPEVHFSPPSQTRLIHGTRYYPAPSISREATYIFPYLINIIITLCLDALGFIQTASLRWSLQRQGRLRFNSNLRILSTTTHFSPHAWYINFVSTIYVVVCYTSASLLFSWRRGLRASDTWSPTNTKPREPIIYWGPQGTPFICLGVALLGQCIITTWCLLTSIKIIPTWSSNPLNTTLACVKDGMPRNWGRCMVPVHGSELSNPIVSARPEQSSAGDSDPRVGKILHWLWLPIILGLISSISIGTTATIFRKSDPALIGDSWDTVGRTGRGFLTDFATYLWSGSGFQFRHSTNHNTANLLNLATLVLAQAYITFGLHCGELLVNMSRDEEIWRTATSKRSVKYSGNSVKEAFRSPQTISLFIIKNAAR